MIQIVIFKYILDGPVNSFLRLSLSPDCQYSWNHVIRILEGSQNLFELHEFSNYRSSNNMISTVFFSELW